MGYYVNPPDNTKEQWLADNGREVVEPTSPLAPPGFLFVCLVDNGPFTAAAVCYDDREYSAFADPSDRRPRRWFMVSVDALRMVVSGLDRVLG